MRAVKKQKRPVECGGRGFSAAKKIDTERFSTMDDLLNSWKGNSAASSIISAAKEMGLELKHLGSDAEEINNRIGRASLKLGRKDKGYCKPVYAVISMVLAKNDRDTAMGLIESMISKAEERETKNHLTNISSIMKEAKGFGLGIEHLGSKREESTADEIVRVATNPRYHYAKNAVAIVMIGQKAPKTTEILVEEILPKCSGSELFHLGSFIRGRMNRNMIDREEGTRLLKEIEGRLDKLWMTPRKS